MFQNHKIHFLKHWNITHNPFEFSKNENWLIDAEKTEDLLQITHSNLNIIIDVGYYNYLYKIYVIYNKDWQKPKETFETDNPNLITEKLYLLMDKYS